MQIWKELISSDLNQVELVQATRTKDLSYCKGFGCSAAVRTRPCPGILSPFLQVAGVISM